MMMNRQILVIALGIAGLALASPLPGSSKRPDPQKYVPPSVKPQQIYIPPTGRRPDDTKVKPQTNILTSGQRADNAGTAAFRSTSSSEEKPDYSRRQRNEPRVPVAAVVAKAIARSLPNLGKALVDNKTSGLEKMNAITLSLLPMTRQIINVRGKASKNYNARYYLQQQEAAEVFVPGLLKLVSDMVLSIPPPTTQPPFQIPNFNIPYNETGYTPEVVIPEVTIPANRFAPEIKIPAVRI
ncbi:uncharacterized protein [Panulirus ornatus]|uniref:uncharacterized protein n=1 Tax=Panulirus ornatus TaxID=150431 RepID=UPI003A84EE94